MAKFPKKHGEAADMVDAFLPKRVKQEDLEVTGVSRSGRVRKKSSKLTDFESPDEIDNRYKRRADRADTPSLNDSSVGLSTHHVIGSGRGRKPHGAGGGAVMERARQVQVKMETRNDSSDQDDIADDFVPKTEPPDSESDSELGMYPEGVDEDSSMDSMGSDEDDDMDDDGLMMNDGRVGGRRESQDNTPSQAQSLYMLEKSSKKKLIIRDGKIVGRMKAQRKDKGKTRFTAYMLWAKEIRQEILRVNPDMDFATMSKRLGELWATVPNNEKYNWKRRAKRLAVKGSREAPTATDTARWKSPPSRSKFINKQAGRNQGQATNSQSEAMTVPTSVAGSGRQHVRQQVVTQATNQNTATANLAVSPPENTKSTKVTSGMLSEPVVGPGLYKVVGSQPVDVAAHLKLLGESLSIIGERLKEHEETSLFESQDSVDDTPSTDDFDHIQPSPSTFLAERRKQNPPQDGNRLQREAMLKAALKAMKKPADSYQVFGDFVANQLRQLPPEKEKKLRLMIQRVILSVCEEETTVQYKNNCL